MAPETSLTSESNIPEPPATEAPLRPLRLKRDAQGHLIPPTEAEQRIRAAAVQRMIEAIRNIPDEPGEDDRDFFRFVDEQRPHRPLFEGMY